MAAEGDTVRLAAEVRDRNGNPMPGAAVNRSSSAATVVTVDPTGLVTAAGNGTATVAASAGPSSGREPPADPGDRLAGTGFAGVRGGGRHGDPSGGDRRRQRAGDAGRSGNVSERRPLR